LLIASLLNVGAGVGAAVVVVVVGAAGVVKLIAEYSLRIFVVVNPLITNKYWVDGDKGTVAPGKLESEEVFALASVMARL